MKSAVVKLGVGGNNEDMNLFLALFWLLCAALLLAYEHYIGGLSRVRVGNFSFSRAWLMITAALMLAAYNLWRWRRLRAYRLRQRVLDIDRANQEWERRRHSTTPAKTPDPNFNFTDEPPPPSHRGITDQPPSRN
jgi:hypothetical protein